MAQLINAQLIQAHAGGRAPLIQAHAGGVGLRIPGVGPLRGISAAQAAAPALRGTSAAQAAPSRAQPRTVSYSSSVAPVAESDYKVTGTSIFDRPDDESVWNDQTRQWMRKWLPGEKEAEATRRVGEVQNELTAERELTAQGRRERAALVEDVVNSIKAGKFSREELPALMEQFGLAKEELAMADSLREREKTLAERIKENTDENGIVWSPDGTKILYNPMEVQAAADQKTRDYELRKAELDAKRLDALKARADKFELELRKPYKVTVGEGDDAIEQTQMRDDAEVKRLMKRRFPELYPQPTDQPAQFPIDETRKLLDPFAEYGGYESLMKPTAQPVTEPTARKKKWGGFAD